MKPVFVSKPISVFLLSLFLCVCYPAFSQSEAYQNGIAVGGGYSRTFFFDKDYRLISSKDIAHKPDFSFEVSFLNTKPLGDWVAFTYGISGVSLRRSFSTGPIDYTRKDESSQKFNFNQTTQVLDRYLVRISFNLAFFLNQGSGRFYIGPGISVCSPVYLINNISGTTSNPDSAVSFKDKYFPEKGPYIFLPAEVFGGYQYEFRNSSLFRIEAFSLARVEGVFAKTDPGILDFWYGLRMAYFFKRD
jgi:hypothetical protein